MELPALNWNISGEKIDGKMLSARKRNSLHSGESIIERRDVQGQKESIGTHKEVQSVTLDLQKMFS
jgi:hypothetical protein